MPSRPLMFAGQNVTNGEVPLQDLTRKKGKEKMYDPKSLKAEEFICHDEVMDSLAYADENKDNKELIRQILDKAALRKGISHREKTECSDREKPERAVYSCWIGTPRMTCLAAP